MFAVFRPLSGAVRVFAVAALCACAPGIAGAARVGVLANYNKFDASAAVAADFSAHVPHHTFTAVDVTSSVPTLASLLARFDVILLFEDGLFDGAPAAGTLAYQFALSGRTVVLGTFYDQDRSDRTLSSLGPPHGWGPLETIDPNTTDGYGTPYQPRTLDPGTLVHHPLTFGVTSLWSGPAPNSFAGGNQAKAGTVVLATWSQANLNGEPDPAIAYRITDDACVIHIGIAPDYAAYGALGTAFGGDFYRVWANAFNFASDHCGIPAVVPVAPAPLVAALALLLAALAAGALRRTPGRA